LKNILFNPEQKLRNGWWILIFIGFVALTRPIYKPIKTGLTELGFTELSLEPLSFILILLATWACTRLRKEPLSSVGFRINGQWFTHLTLGTLIGTLLTASIVALIWAVNGVHLELNAERSIGALTTGLYIFLFVALMEELLLRGFIFQRLIDGAGIWIAQITFAVIFAAGHFSNPGMEGWTKIIASTDLFLGAILFGLAYIKTRSLALPIGLHLGWNWSMGNVMGFGVSGIEHTGWFTPVFGDKASWLTGGEFGPEASIFALMIDALAILLLWKWRGSAAQKEQIEHSSEIKATATVSS